MLEESRDGEGLQLLTLKNGESNLLASSPLKHIFPLHDISVSQNSLCSQRAHEFGDTRKSSIQEFGRCVTFSEYLILHIS